jgi:hypothetical protein
MTPSQLRKGSSAFHLLRSSPAKGRVLGRLGWNSYGTEGAQRVANVRLFERPKFA